MPPAVDRDADVAREDVAQRHDDRRAVVAPHRAVAVVAGEVDAQLELGDRVPRGRAEEGFDQVRELAGGVWDGFGVVRCGGGEGGVGLRAGGGEVGAVRGREGRGRVDACEVDAAGLGDEGGREGAEDVQAGGVGEEEAGGAGVFEVEVGFEFVVDLLVD